MFTTTIFGYVLECATRIAPTVTILCYGYNTAHLHTNTYSGQGLTHHHNTHSNFVVCRVLYGAGMRQKNSAQELTGR